MPLKIEHKNPRAGRKAELNTFLFWGWIRISTQVKKDSPTWKAAMAHEMTHWRQYTGSFGIHYLRYRFSRKYRLRAELEAYANEYRSYSEADLKRLEQYAKWIARDYNLDVSKLQALELLKALI